MSLHDAPSSDLTLWEFRVYMTAFASCRTVFDQRKDWATEAVLQWRSGGPTKAQGFGELAKAMYHSARRMAAEQDATARLNSDKPLEFITHDEMMRDLDDEEDVDATLRGMDEAMGAKTKRKDGFKVGSFVKVKPGHSYSGKSGKVLRRSVHKDGSWTYYVRLSSSFTNPMWLQDWQLAAYKSKKRAKKTYTPCGCSLRGGGTCQQPVGHPGICQPQPERR